MNRTLSAALASLFLLTAACTDSTTTPESPGTSPDASIDGRVAPDANGNNRDQPQQTTAAPTP